MDKAIYELCSIEVFGVGGSSGDVYVYNIYTRTARYSVFRVSSEVLYSRR